MKNFFYLLLTVSPAVSFANEIFEINQKNCNIPIKEIRKRLPEKSKQEQDAIVKACIKKANNEGWKRNKLAQQS